MTTGFRLTLLCLVLLRANRGAHLRQWFRQSSQGSSCLQHGSGPETGFETMSSSCLYLQSEYEPFVLPNRQIRKIGLCIRTAPKRNLAARGA
jgi:hypothetical protein